MPRSTKRKVAAAAAAAIAATALGETHFRKSNMLVSPRSSSQQTPMIPMEATGGGQRDSLHDSSDSAVSGRERRSLGCGDQTSGTVSNDQQITEGHGVDDSAAACATGSAEMTKGHGVDGGTAACATSSAEDDKAGDGSDTYSGRDKGGTKLIEDYSPSSVQGEKRDSLDDSSRNAVSSREQKSLGSSDHMRGNVSNDQQIRKGLGLDDGAAACATSPAEHDKAGDGSDTCSDGDKGGATLIEGSPPSSAQNDTNQSPPVGKPTKK